MLLTRTALEACLRKKLDKNGRKAHYQISAVGSVLFFFLIAFHFLIITILQAGTDSRQAVLHFYFPVSGFFITIARLSGFKSFR